MKIADVVLEKPVSEAIKLEKTIAKVVPESTVHPTNIKQVKKSIEKEQVKIIAIDEPVNIVVEKVQNVDNELIESVLEQAVIAEKGPIMLTPIGQIQPSFLKPTSTNDDLNNLENALLVDIPVEEMAGITIQKKKRSIKDFLGRFPVTQLKEALIPTYYKEENAGQ